MAKLDPELASMITDMYQTIHAMSPDSKTTDFGKWINNRLSTSENNAKQLTQKEISERSKEFKKLLDALGLATKSTDKLVLEMTKAFQAREQQGTKISKAMMNNAYDELLRKLYDQYNKTMQANQNLVNPKMPLASFGSSTAQKNNATQRAVKIISQNNTGNFLDTATEKLIAFFSGTGSNSGFNKTLKKFGLDLIEGLKNNKFFGGAISDMIKLVALLGGSWLKDKFGPLGKYLAGALVAAGPVLGKIVVDLIAKAFKMGGYFLFSQILKGCLFGSILLSNALKGAVYNFMPALLGAITSPKGAILKTAGLGGAALTAFGVSAWAGTEAVKTWKQGGKANKTAAGFLGAGSATAAGTGLAILAAGLTSPITVILAAITGVALSIGLIIKYHKQIGEYFKKLVDHILPWLAKDKNGERTGSAARPSDYKTGLFAEQKGGGTGFDKSKINESVLKIADQTKAAIDPKTGAITNFALMTKQQAERQMEAYRKRDPEKWNALYEIVPKELVSMSSFKTDLVAPGGVGVYAGKGTTARLQEIRKRAESAGEDPSQILMSGGIGSMASYDPKTGKYQITPHVLSGTITSHTSPYGTGADIVTGSANTKVMSKIMSDLFGTHAVYEKDHWDIKLGETPEVREAKAVISGKVTKTDKAESSKNSIKVNEPEAKKEEEPKPKTEVEERANTIRKSGGPGSRTIANFMEKHPTMFKNQLSSFDATGNMTYSKRSKQLADISWLGNYGAIS